MPRVKAITLDLWGTLIKELPNNNYEMRVKRKEEIYSELASMDHKYDMTVIERAYLLSGEYLKEVWARNRDLPTEDHLLFLLTCIDSKLPSKLGDEGLQRMRNVYTETLLRYPPVLFEDVRGSLERLKNAGFRLGLISNTGRTPGSTLRLLMKRLKIEEYFDHMTFSNEVLLRKPELGIFRHALSGLKVTPRHAAHVGDDPLADFEGAEAAGMMAILINRRSKGGKEPNTIRSLDELPHIFR